MSVRISAADLRAAARKTAAIKAAAHGAGEPAPEVLLDVHVVIEREAAVALATLDTEPAQRNSLSYVGTARGLAGLISDVQRMGIADGVVLLTSDQDHVTELMLDEMAPGLGGRATRAAAA